MFCRSTRNSVVGDVPCQAPCSLTHSIDRQLFSCSVVQCSVVVQLVHTVQKNLSRLFQPTTFKTLTMWPKDTKHQTTNTNSHKEHPIEKARALHQHGFCFFPRLNRFLKHCATCFQHNRCTTAGLPEFRATRTFQHFSKHNFMDQLVCKSTVKQFKMNWCDLDFDAGFCNATVCMKAEKEKTCVKETNRTANLHQRIRWQHLHC